MKAIKINIYIRLSQTFLESICKGKKAVSNEKAKNYLMGAI